MKSIRIFVLGSSLLTAALLSLGTAQADSSRDAETIRTEIRENSREIQGHELRARSLERNIINTEQNPSDLDPRRPMLEDMKAELDQVRSEIRDLKDENEQLEKQLHERASLANCATEDRAKRKPASKRGDDLDAFVAGFQQGMNAPKKLQNDPRCASISTKQGSKPDAYTLGYHAGDKDARSGTAH